VIKILIALVMMFVIVEAGCAAPPEPRGPEDLLQYIRSAEQEEIRESWGEEAAECFTWVDYDAFVSNERPVAVANKLKATPQFHALMDMVKKLPEPAQRELLERARLQARPTWAMIGRISREGTTEAGRKAGLLLAGAIVAAVEEGLKNG
jgi:hypothetical protein